MLQTEILQNTVVSCCNLKPLSFYCFWFGLVLLLLLLFFLFICLFVYFLTLTVLN